MNQENHTHGAEAVSFAPVLKETVWGGERLYREYGYGEPGRKIGECWAVSAHPNGDCVVREGAYRGRTLSQLWREEPQLFGGAAQGEFPLLVKVIDAADDLSIQVHPNDAYAAANENGSLGKTECWYILDCAQDARLVIGHNARTKEELAEMVAQGRWKELIREVPVHKGDFVQINPGTVHAIKGGIMLLETQQSSDVTYRLYDYDRLSDGKLRPLHIRQSLDVITVPAEPADVKETASLPANELHLLIACRYYRVWKLALAGSFSMAQDCPFLLMSVVAGTCRMNGRAVGKGEHLLLPAGYGRVEIEGEAEIIFSSVNE